MGPLPGASLGTAVARDAAVHDDKAGREPDRDLVVAGPAGDLFDLGLGEDLEMPVIASHPAIVDLEPAVRRAARWEVLVEGGPPAPARPARLGDAEAAARLHPPAGRPHARPRPA